MLVKEKFPGLSYKFLSEVLPLKRTTPVIPAEDIQRQKEYCAELRALNRQRSAPPLAYTPRLRPHSPPTQNPGLGGGGRRKKI